MSKFIIKEISKEEKCKVYDNRFCGYCFRLKHWPEDLAVCKTKDQISYISEPREKFESMTAWICGELLEVIHPDDIEVVEDNFPKFQRNFLMSLVDPDLFDTEEEKLQVAESFISQCREMASS